MLDDKGAQSGQDFAHKRMLKNLQKVITDEGEFTFADICATLEYSH